MHDWKNKINRKRTRQSHTPGRTKTKACQADYIKRTLAKRSRSYKILPVAFANWYIVFGRR